MTSSNNYNFNQGFADQIRAFNLKAANLTDAVVKKIVFDMATRIVMKSPVGDPDLWKNPHSAPPGYVGGRFRANWQYGIGQINTLVTDDIDETGEISLSELTKVPTPSYGIIHYWTNSLPYAITLEDGHSTQAPQGIVGLTVLEFQETVTAAAAYVKVNGIGIS